MEVSDQIAIGAGDNVELDPVHTQSSVRRPGDRSARGAPGDGGQKLPSRRHRNVSERNDRAELKPNGSAAVCPIEMGHVVLPGSIGGARYRHVGRGGTNVRLEQPPAAR